MRTNGSIQGRVDGDFRIEVSATPDITIGAAEDWLRHIYVYLGDTSLSFVAEDFDVADIAAELRSAADELVTWADTRIAAKAARVPA